MPWTRRQVRFLESSASPLTSAQKTKMNAELHSDPSLGHKKKGSDAMKKPAHNLREMRIEIHKGHDGTVTGHTVHHEFEPTSSKSGAFLERPERESYPFGAGQHKEMAAHIVKHIGGRAEAGKGAKDEAKESKESETEVEREEEEGE